MAISRSVITRVGNLLAFLVLLLINGLGFFLPLGEKGIGMNVLTPLDFGILAMLVWAAIYGLMVAFVLYQLLPCTYQCEYINRGISPYFIAHCLANAGWVLAQSYVPSSGRYIELVFIYFILICLLLSYLTVSFITTRDLRQEKGSNDHYYFHFLFGRAWLSIYLGWIICCASTVSFSALTDLDSFSFKQAAITFGAVGAVALIFLAVNWDFLFGAVVVWASAWLAISNKQGRENVDYEVQWPLFVSAVTVASIVGLASLVSLAKTVLFLFRRAVKLRNSDPAIPVKEDV